MPEPLTDEELEVLASVLDLARNGATDDLVAATRAGVPVNLTGPTGDTLLILAAYHNHPDTVRALLAEGADPERVNDRGQTALGAAVFRQSATSVQALLAAGAGPHTGARSAVALAEFFGLPEMRALLEGPPVGRGDDRLPDDYFDRLYRQDPDPWRLGVGFYERRKRELIMACLPRPRFDACFEPGCALGLNTVELAKRCERVLATDVSAAALETTRDRVRALGNVEVERAAVPDEWPTGRFDLVVLSEVGYYVRDLAALAHGIQAALTDDGVLVACHWLHPAPDYPSTAPEVHDAVGRGLDRIARHVEEDFLLDVWARDGTSVARQAGLVS